MLCTPSTRCLLDGVAVRILRARVVAGVEFVKSTWDAAPRTEHAVLAAGEALEVTAAAHFAAFRGFFCLLIAPLRATSGQPPKAGCSVQPAGNRRERNLLRVRAAVCVRQQVHFDLAIGLLVGACEPLEKKAKELWYDSNATSMPKQQQSTSPEGR